MSATYASHYEAVFLCLHPKELKMSYGAAVKYLKKSKTFLSKWVKRYSDIKTKSMICQIVPLCDENDEKR